jgi:hypothetical protein
MPHSLNPAGWLNKYEKISVTGGQNSNRALAPSRRWIRGKWEGECVYGRGILTKFLGVHWGYNRKRWSCRVLPGAGRTRCLSWRLGACIAAQNNAQRAVCKWSPMTSICNETVTVESKAIDIKLHRIPLLDPILRHFRPVHIHTVYFPIFTSLRCFTVQ